MSSHPVTIALRSIRCIEETDEVGSDEPYVLVTACALAGLVPQVEVTLYGPFGDVDKGETHSTVPIPPGLTQQQSDIMAGITILRRPCWSLDNRSAQTIPDPSKVILIVSMMENDDASASAARTIVKGAATSALANSLNLPRADRVKKLIADINGALDIPTGAPNFDDLIGSKELALAASDLGFTAKGQKKSRSLDFKGDGGHYRATFDIVSH